MDIYISTTYLLIYYHYFIMRRIKNRKLSYPNGMIRSEVFIAPALDVPDTFDGGDPIVGDEYLGDGL